MISRSLGHGAEFFYASREAGRRTPMMAADRSTRSCSTILFLFVLIGSPVVAASATLEESAKEFAQKISSNLPNRENVYVEVRNTSSLQTNEASLVEEKLTAELQGRGIRMPGSSATASVVVTLSENLNGFVWTAEIRQGDAFRTVLLFVPRLVAAPKSADVFPLKLASERFWVGPERALDAAPMVAPNGDQLVVFLLPETLVIQNASKSVENRIHISLGMAPFELREPWGTLSQSGNSVVIVHGRRDCSVSLETYTLTECRDSGVDVGFGGEGPSQPGGQVEPVLTKCTKITTFFVTGTGDDTQPDSLRVVGTIDSLANSNQVNFSGPVVAIHGNSSGTPARAIVRNVQTGNYEGHLLSISCAP